MRGVRTAIALAGVGILAATPVWAQAAYGYGYAHPHMMGGAMFGGGHFFGGLLMMLAVVALIVLVARGVRRWPHHGDAKASVNGALTILQERFAKGEVSSEEYQERRKVLLG